MLGPTGENIHVFVRFILWNRVVLHVGVIDHRCEFHCLAALSITRIHVVLIVSHGHWSYMECIEHYCIDELGSNTMTYLASISTDLFVSSRFINTLVLWYLTLVGGWTYLDCCFLWAHKCGSVSSRKRRQYAWRIQTCDAFDPLQLFASFSLCLELKFCHLYLQRWLRFAKSSADVSRDLPLPVRLQSINSVNCIL